MAVDSLLRRFEFTVLKNRSGTDNAQVPALGTFTFFKQGATVKTTTILHPGDPPPIERTLSVDWPGQLVKDQVVVSGGGTRTYIDWLGGPAVVLPSLVDARDFPNLDLAIAACADGLETTVQLAAGTYQSIDTLVIPPSKRVRLRGAGREQTRIHCADPAKDIVWVKGDGCSLEDLTVHGPGMAPSNQDEFTGRGVVIGKLGAEATSPTRDFWMSNVGIRDTASWGLWCVGWDDPNGVEGSSLVVLSRFERSIIEKSVKFGLLRARRGCTTLDFSSCRLLRPPGYAAKVESCEQLTFTNCVFEDSDDTQPYVEIENTTSTAFIQCWFEHHGGWVAPRDSNTQRFVRVRNYCRGTTLLGCHFVRNAADAPSTFKPGNPFAVEVGETNADPFARARGTAILNCDFSVPGTIAGDNHIVTYNGSDMAVLASRVQAVSSGALPVPMFHSPSILEVAPAGSGVWSTLLGWAGRIRLPRFNASDPVNPELDSVGATPGDIRFNIGLDRIEVRTSTGWKKVALEP